MGGMWDKCASDARHPKFETGAEEAVIAWSAPHAWHPEAKVSKGIAATCPMYACFDLSATLALSGVACTCVYAAVV